jgi:hypothetical protein
MCLAPSTKTDLALVDASLSKSGIVAHGGIRRNGTSNPEKLDPGMYKEYPILVEPGERVLSTDPS